MLLLSECAVVALRLWQARPAAMFAKSVIFRAPDRTLGVEAARRRPDSQKTARSNTSHEYPLPAYTKASDAYRTRRPTCANSPCGRLVVVLIGRRMRGADLQKQWSSAGISGWSDWRRGFLPQPSSRRIHSALRRTIQVAKLGTKSRNTLRQVARRR
jgi:hypothetical protein